MDSLSQPDCAWRKWWLQKGTALNIEKVRNSADFSGLTMPLFTTDIYIGDEKTVFEWSLSRLAKIKDTVDYVSALGLGDVVAVWDTKKTQQHPQ